FSIMRSSRTAVRLMSAARRLTSSTSSRSASCTCLLERSIPTNAVLNSWFSVVWDSSSSLSIERNSFRSMIMLTVRSRARVAVSDRIARETGEEEGHPALLLLGGTPDREDEDGADQDVGDRVGEVKCLRRRIRLIYRPQAEPPRSRGQRERDDDTVEPDPPAR